MQAPWHQLISLGEARFGSGDVTPLLDDWLLDLPWVGAGPGADLLGDVHTLLSRLQEGHKLGDVLALLLGLQAASLLWDLSDNSLSLLKALLWAGLQLTTRWAAELTWDLLALSFRRVLLDTLLLLGTDLLGPLGTLLLGGVTLGDILALLLLLRLKVSSVGGVALLAVAMLALDDIIVLSLLNHDDLVNTPLSGSGNGSNVQSDIVLTVALTSITGRDSSCSMSSMVMGMVMMVMVMSSACSSSSVLLVEWEGSPQVLALSVGASCGGTASHQQQHAKAAESVHVLEGEPAGEDDNTSTA